MKTIIIHYEKNPIDAINKVQAVIEAGKISEAGGIKHYCWATRFKSGGSVYTNRKRNKDAADSFIVT